MSTGNIPFVAFKPHASRLEKYKDRSQASKHTSRVSSKKLSEARLDSLRQSLHSSTKSIASWQAPPAFSSGNEPPIPSPTPTSPIPNSNDVRSPSLASAISSSDVAQAVDSNGLGTPLCILQYLDSENTLVELSDEHASREDVPRVTESNNLYEQSRSMALLGIGASVIAKASPECNHAQQTSLGIRLQLIHFIRLLIRQGPSNKRSMFAYLLSIYGLFKMECIEGNTTAAQYHANALEALFQADIYSPDILAQVLSDDVAIAIKNGDRTLLDMGSTSDRTQMAPARLQTLWPRISGIRSLVHPGITYRHLYYLWSSLRKRVEEMSWCSSSGRAELSHSESSLQMLLYQGQLNNMREDLIDGAVMHGTSLHDRLHQAAMAVVLHMLSISAFGSVYTDGPALAVLLSKLRDLLTYMSQLAAVPCCTAAGSDLAMEESKLFALFVGSVMEYRLQATTPQSQPGQCGQSMFATLLSRAANGLGVDSASEMQQLAEMFWPPYLLSCNFSPPGWSFA